MKPNWPIFTAETYIESNENLEELDNYTTPKPNKKNRDSKYHIDLEEDEDVSAFVSPLKARKKPVTVADSDSDDDGSLQVKAKRKGKDKRVFKLREMVQEKRTAMTATANNKRVYNFLLVFLMTDKFNLHYSMIGIYIIRRR